MLRDVEFFNSRIGKLDGAGEIAGFLIQLVKNKRTAQPAAEDPAPAQKDDTETALPPSQSSDAEKVVT